MKRILQISAALLLAFTTANAQTITGSLTSSSPLCAGVDGGSLSYYFDAYTFEITDEGSYMFLASTDFDSYGQLYKNDSFYYEYPMYNAILFQDDSIDVDFGFEREFEAGKYTLVVSTFNGLETGSYSVTASGPSTLTFSSATLVAGEPPSDPLPLTLLSFTAQKQNNNSAILKWTTASEKNVSYFGIEKSIDGKKYEKVGKIIAVGKDEISTQSYSFTDFAINPGVNTYRLKMTDLDGSFTYSNVAAVIGQKLDLQVFLSPNPALSRTILQVNSSSANVMNVKILDLAGKVVSNHDYNIEAGHVELPLQVSTLPASIYMLQWSMGTESGILKMIKE